MKEFLAEKNIHNFYDDLYDPSKPTEEFPNGSLVLLYNHNNSENYLFIDGSIVSNKGDYRENSTTIVPNKELLLSFIENNSEYHLKVIDNKFDNKLKPESLDYSTRATILRSDGSCEIKSSDEQGFNESYSLDKNETKKLFNENFGIDFMHMQEALKQKNKKKELSFISKFLTKYTNKEKKSNNSLKN